MTSFQVFIELYFAVIQLSGIYLKRKDFYAIRNLIVLGAMFSCNVFPINALFLSYLTKSAMILFNIYRVYGRAVCLGEEEWSPASVSIGQERIEGT